MKILALERESSAADEAYAPHLEAEARRVLELFQGGSLREISFRLDEPRAVLVLECASEQEAEGLLATLPLVEQGLIEFELIPLRPYPGFARLFRERSGGNEEAGSENDRLESS
jgi:hypothetical protein